MGKRLADDQMTETQRNKRFNAWSHRTPAIPWAPESTKHVCGAPSVPSFIN